MKIAVNTRLLLKDKLDGIGWFSFECLKRITTQHPEHQFYFIFDRKFDEQFIFSDNITPIVKPPQARHPWLFYLWFEDALPPVFKQTGADIFLSPDGFLSLSSPVKSVAVIHDLNFEHFPEHLPRHITRYYRRNFPKFARKACRIATVSEFSKSDIAETYGIDENKIDVVYNGVNESFKPLEHKVRQQVRDKYALGCPYFIFVGSLHPRKNLTNLFKAFELFKSRHENNFKLMIAGAKMWWTSDIRKAYEQMKFKDDVIFTGRVNSDELNHLIGAAFAMTYVSFFEGFGIPVLEAFSCEVPLITSSASSLPEITSNAALLVDPFSPVSIANAMSELLSDEMLCSSLIGRGRVQKQNFTWQKSADRLWNCIMKAGNR